jgi:hypothetical protein
MKQNPIARKYLLALKTLIGRPLTPPDGLPRAQLIACEHRLKLRLPSALRSYYELAGKLGINTEHHQLYSPRELRIENRKLVFMGENQAVVFWSIDLKDLKKPDPLVYQANNESEVVWHSKDLCFSDWIIKIWRWQAGLDPDL